MLRHRNLNARASQRHAFSPLGTTRRIAVAESTNGQTTEERGVGIGFDVKGSQ